MSVIIKIGILFLNIIYSVLKLLPVSKKIVYISRQSNTVPIDFELIKHKMENMLPKYTNIVLARTIDPGIIAKIRYFFHMFRQMYHVATARLVILDTYCITVSILKQRESLMVIQIWHALGALKKFGYSILDKGEGSSSKIARLMKMHNNYSYVFTSGEKCRIYFSEAFHQDIETVKVFPLPRLDLLLDKERQEKIKNKIIKKYPFLHKDGKKVVLYAPTFRKDEHAFISGAFRLFKIIDFERYNLIYMPHPLTDKVDNLDKRIIYDISFTTEDMFCVSDCLVTDYSAIIFEAMLLKKRIILYAFDFERYTQKRDFYLDYLKVFSGCISQTADQVVKLLENGNDTEMEWESHLNDFIAAPQISYTEDICDFLINLGNL